MVKPGGSRPAALSQREVDDLARGEHAGAAKLLHAARHAPPVPESPTPASGPVSLAAKEMQAIARSGTAPAAVVERIAAATPAVAGKVEGRARVAPASERGRSAPALKPPDPATRG